MNKYDGNEADKGPQGEGGGHESPGADRGGLSVKEIEQLQLDLAVSRVETGILVVFLTAILLSNVKIEVDVNTLDEGSDPSAAAAPCLPNNGHLQRLQIPSIDKLELPPDISDAGLIFFASAPTDLNLRTDTLMSNRDISRLLFNGQILGLGVSIGQDWNGLEQRFYHFTLPSPSNGEVLAGQTTDAMRSMGWIEVLNSLMDTSKLQDSELKKYLHWFYRNRVIRNDTSSVELDQDKIAIERDSSGNLTSIRYTGQSTSIIFNELRIDSTVPETSREANRSYEKVARPMMAQDGRLLLWLGVEQDLLIPESLLKPANDLLMNFDLRIKGSQERFKGSASLLSDSMRHYFETRNNGQVMQYTQYGSQQTSTMGWAHFVNPQDEMAKWIIGEIVDPNMNACEKANEIRTFWQENTGYEIEYNVEVNRPMGASLLGAEPGGDCNNSAIGLATLYKAAGLEAALVFADTDPTKVDSSMVYSSHLLTALSVDQLGQNCATAGMYGTDDGRTWVLSEPQGDLLIGEFPLEDQLTVRFIEPIK